MQFLILFAAAAAAPQSPTQNLGPAATEFVTYADLDLSTAIGRRRLEHRVVAAVSSLCTEDSNGSPAAYINSKCFRASVERAHAQMERAIGTAVAAASAPGS